MEEKANAGVPSESVPSESVPSESVPSESVPSEKNTHENNVVQINVGGTVFTTTLQTLHRCSYFKELDCIPSFIDRNPLYFGAILDFLRGSPLMLPPNGNYAQMKMECAYFGLYSKEKKSAEELWFDDKSFLSVLVLPSEDSIYIEGLDKIFKNDHWKSKWQFIASKKESRLQQATPREIAVNALMEYLQSIGFKCKSATVQYYRTYVLTRPPSLCL